MWEERVSNLESAGINCFHVFFSSLGYAVIRPFYYFFRSVYIFMKWYVKLSLSPLMSNVLNSSIPDEVKGKEVKLSLCLTKHHTMKMYWGSGGIAPRILDLGTRWRWVVSFTARPLYFRGKSPWYPLNWTLGGPQSRFGRGGGEKNSQPPPGIEP
jgi:hypothetical protein